MRRSISAAALMAVFCGFCGTATKDYVDRRDAETLASANAYTDAHSGGGAVVSVNGQTGVVHLAAADVGAVPLTAEGGKDYKGGDFGILGDLIVGDYWNDDYPPAFIVKRVGSHIEVDVGRANENPEYKGVLRVAGTNVMDAIAAKPDAATVSNIVASAETTYAATNAIVALNQSVQFATVASGSSLTILAPAAVEGGIRDWIVYANAADDDTPLILPPRQWYAADPASTNALKAGVTVLYITEVPSGGFVLGRQELKPITIAE